MAALRLCLIGGWLFIAAVTVWALAAAGLLEAPRTFVSDLAHPWRAQFYADLELHLLLVGVWMTYRERSLARGLACAAATLLLGALFSLAYLLFESIRARGDGEALLLGSRRRIS